MTTRLSENDTSAETPDVIAAEETLAIQQAAPDPLLRADAAEVPPLMAPHPEAGFNVLEDEEEAARKGVGTGVGVVPFDKLKETIEHIDDQGRRVVVAELEVPMGLGLGDEAERQELTRLEEERLDEAELRRGGARGAKGVEDIRREVVAKRRQQQQQRKTSGDDDDQAKRRLPSKGELREEAELERRRVEVQDDIDATLARRAAGGEHKHEEEKDRVAVEPQVNEDNQMVVDELFNGTINDGSPLEPALDEARSLKSYFGEVLHEANEARRREAEEAERDRRLYYREHGVDDDEWTGADAAERADEKLPLLEAAALGVTDIGLARMVAEEVEAARYNEAAAAERKRRREEDAAHGTPFFPAKRRNSLRGELARQMRADRERDQASALDEERLAREGRSTDEPVVNPGFDVTAEEDVYDYPANEGSVYYAYGAEQLDYGDMVHQDQGDYDTLRPFDGDEDLLREEKQEERNERRDGERDGRKVLEQVREEVLALEGCLNAPPGTLGRDGDDRSVAAEAQPLVPKVERLPAWSARGMTKADARRRLHRAAQRPIEAAAARQDEAKATKTSTNA